MISRGMWFKPVAPSPDGFLFHFEAAMSSSDLLKNFLEGNVPKHIRLVAARGLVPLPPSEMLQLLVRLVRDPDPEVSSKASETLGGWSEDDLVAQLQVPECNQDVLDHFADSEAPAVQEAIVLNPAATGPVTARLASKAPAQLLETILYNRTRLLDSPEILESVKANPAATAEILRLIEEVETEFFGGKKSTYTVGEQAQTAIEQEQVFGLQTELPPDNLILEGLPIDPQERETAILNRLGSLTVRQKIQLALMGTREIRSVLVRDTNKEVSRSVLQSPKLSVSEIEGFAAMRNCTEEILRLIGSSKAWTKSYGVVHNLVRNPKTPPLISQRLMIRLLSKDLKLLSRDRGLPEAVRRNAERMLKQRGSSKSIG